MKFINYIDTDPQRNKIKVDVLVLWLINQSILTCVILATSYSDGCALALLMLVTLSY